MCTLLILNQMSPEYPVIVAANRDEFLERPATDAQVLLEDPRTIGGVDLQSQGTWMGATADGYFVGLTNQRSFSGMDVERLSRGPLVLNTLRAGSLDAGLAFLRSLKGSDYNPFNLLLGDSQRLFVAYGRVDQPTIRIEEVPPGIQILPNDVLNSPLFPKVQRARTLLEPHDFSTLAWGDIVSILQQALSDRELPPLESVPYPSEGSQYPHELFQELQALRVALPGYGTRSATIVALQPSKVAHYLFTNNAPDQSSLEDITSLLYSSL